MLKWAFVLMEEGLCEPWYRGCSTRGQRGPGNHFP